jgi:hypothetical protein
MRHVLPHFFITFAAQNLKQHETIHSFPSLPAFRDTNGNGTAEVLEVA